MLPLKQVIFCHLLPTYLMTLTTPLSPNRNPVVSKEIRYDRQLRLWGDGGQRKLEASRVCLLNAGALGTEVLKVNVYLIGNIILCLTTFVHSSHFRALSCPVSDRSQSSIIN